MEIFEIILIVFGIVMFINVLFDKWNVWSDLERMSADVTREWMYQLLNCRFCVLFHITWMITLITGIVDAFSWSLLIVPMVVGGFIHVTLKK